MSIVVPTLLWANLAYTYVWIALFALVSFAGIGFIDDYAKLMKKRNLGLTSRQKFLYQMGVALLLTMVLVIMSRSDAYSTAMNIPFFKQFQPDLSDSLPTRLALDIRAGFHSVFYLRRSGGRGLLKRGEFDGRPGWTCDWADGDLFQRAHRSGVHGRTS